MAMENSDEKILIKNRPFIVSTLCDFDSVTMYLHQDGILTESMMEELQVLISITSVGVYVGLSRFHVRKRHLHSQPW